MFKIGVSYWAFIGGARGRKDIVKAIREAAAAGFDAIELSLSRRGQLAIDTPVADAAAIGRSAQDIGLEIDSLTTLLLYEIKLLSADAAERQAAVAIVGALVRLADAAGARCVSLPLIGAADQAPALLPLLSEELDKDGTGITLCIENVRADSFVQPEELDQLLNGLPADRIGLCLDIGNTLPDSSPEQWIAHFAGRIGKVHLTDFLAEPTAAARSVDVGEGEISWPPVLQALAAAGYQGPLIAEAFPRPRERDGKRLARLNKAMRAACGSATG